MNTDTDSSPTREDLYVPDRFEGMSGVELTTLRSIVAPVDSTLKLIDRRFREMRASRRGSFMILRGDTGTGKSTFLDTIGLFRKEVKAVKISEPDNIQRTLSEVDSESLSLIALDGREALGLDSEESLEAILHSVNGFLRSGKGRNSLVVWPTNTDELTELLKDKAQKLGGTALLGTGDSVISFSGPSRAQFVEIATRTVGALNEGASLAALGVSESQALNLTEKADTIGQYLGMIRDELLKQTDAVQDLLPSEQFRLWVLVVSGNDTEGDVAALTRGGFAYADIDRLITATDANVVKELKKAPEKLGILGSVLDTKILNMDNFTALAIARNYGNGNLHALMKGQKCPQLRIVPPVGD